MTLSTTQELINRADTGEDEATRGSSTGVDTNDPLFLNHTGTHYVYLPGVTDNYLSVPDEAALDITDDIEIVSRVDLDSWPPASDGVLVTKGTNAYRFYVASNGKLTVNIASLLSQSTIAVPGTPGWLKMTRRISDGRIQFFYAADQSTEPSSWTQLGADVTGNTTSMTNNATAVRVGATTTGAAPLEGSLYRTIVRDGIDGTKVLDIDLDADIDTSADPDDGQASFTCTTGQTVTVNRSSSGNMTTVVTRPVMSFDGSDDYLQLPSFDEPTFTATTGQYSGLILFRTTYTAANICLWSSESALNNGLRILVRAGGDILLRVGNGTATNEIFGSNLNNGDLHVAGFVVDDGMVYGYTNDSGLSSGVDFSARTGLAHMAPRVGTRAYAIVEEYAGEILASVQFADVAKTEGELDTIAAALMGDYT